MDGALTVIPFYLFIYLFIYLFANSATLNVKKGKHRDRSPTFQDGARDND